MNAKHVGNVSAAEPHRGHASRAAVHLTWLSERVVHDKHLRWAHICILEQGVWDGEKKNTIYWTQLMSGRADGNHIMQLF